MQYEPFGLYRCCAILHLRRHMHFETVIASRAGHRQAM